MKNTALPKRVTSKNPVVILRHVIKAIQDEPKRYDQAEIVLMGDPKSNDDLPTCGTIACVAGWTNILTNARKPMDLDRAGRILGLTEAESGELFDAMPDRVRARWAVTPRQHAADGVKHIKRFVLKKWGKRI